MRTGRYGMGRLQAMAGAPPAGPLHGAVTTAMCLGIFALDAWTPADGAAAVLFTVLLVEDRGDGRHRRHLIALALACAFFTIASYLPSHGLAWDMAGAVRRGVSLLAIAATAFMTLQTAASRQRLDEQAGLLELTDNAVVVVEPDGRIGAWNRAAETIYGWPAGLALGQSADRLLGGWEPDATAGERVRRRRDGSAVTVAARRQAIGGPGQVVDTSIDISGRKQAAGALARSEHRYRSVFAALGTAMWEEDRTATAAWLTQLARDGGADRHGLTAPDAVRSYLRLVRVVDANAAAVRLLGARSKAELAGSPARLVPDRSLPALAELPLALASGRTSFEAEVELATLQGGTVTVLLSLTVPPAPHGHGNVLVSLTDLTERRRIEARLRAATGDLDRLTRISALGEATAAIAHEVNQPLAATIASAEAALRWLDRPRPDMDEARAALARVVREGHRAAAMNLDLRSLAPSLPRAQEDIDLPALLRETLRLSERDAGARGIRLCLEADPGLPALRLSHVRVQQVVHNLVANALQAMERDGAGHVLVTARSPAPDRVTVSVADTGSGAPGGDPERMFEPFFTTRPAGMGLGLSICRSLLEAEGGGIRAEANAGPGLTMTITLPVQPHA